MGATEDAATRRFAAAKAKRIRRTVHYTPASMRFEHEEVVNRPAREVFAYLSDPANLPEWQGSVVEARRESGGEIAVGSTFRETRSLLGRRVESVLEVTEYEPEKRFSLRTLTGPVRISVRHVLESIDGATRIRITGEGEPGGFVKMPGPLLARMVRKQAESDFATLKRVLESRV